MRSTFAEIDQMHKSLKFWLQLNVTLTLLMTGIIIAMCAVTLTFNMMLFNAWEQTTWLELCPMEVNWKSGNLRPEVRRLAQWLVDRGEVKKNAKSLSGLKRRLI